jgi:hypothetical protein
MVLVLDMPFQNHHTMLTFLLFLALLISCYFIFKSIDWFEKI